MIIKSQAPSRISLFGGGTDLPTYASEYGGCVLSMAINLRQKLIMYSGEDLINFNDGKGGENIIPYRGKHEFYYQILDEYGINDMHHTKLISEYDGLLEAGLGSSASAAVALIGCIDKRLNLGLDRTQIAEKAWELETKKLNLFGGRQDQYAATYGGVNYFEFDNRDKKVKVARLDHGFIEPFLPYFVLLYTGFNRQSATIQEGLKELSGPQVEALDKVKATAMNGIQAMVDHDYYEVGRLLQQSWEHKKESNKGVTTPEIDNIEKVALKNGAIGFKTCGAGGGGFILCMCPPDKQKKLIAALKEVGCVWWDFDVSWSGLETRILP